MDAEVGFEPTSLGYEPSKATTPPLRNIKFDFVIILRLALYGRNSGRLSATVVSTALG